VWKKERITVPTGVARFPKEMHRPPRSWVEKKYNVVRWTEMPRGGHFAALEQPALFANDVLAFFHGLRG
jgi:pimeloyl-ACP methyl ester carboxylesterase